MLGSVKKLGGLHLGQGAEVGPTVGKYGTIYSCDVDDITIIKECTCKQPLAPANGCPNVPQWCIMCIYTTLNIHCNINGEIGSRPVARRGFF